MSAYIDSIINNALATANSQTAYADQAASATMTASQGYAFTAFEPAKYDIKAIEPAVPDIGDSLYNYEAQRELLIKLLSDKLAEFFTLYYPLASDAFDGATNWLVNAITKGGTGINPSVEQQIWQRDRDRVVTEGLRNEAQTLNEFTGRGFSLPPGAAASRLQAIKTASIESLQASSRDAAIKKAEMEVENVRFAVEEAIKARLGALSAAADYIRGMMSAPDSAAKIASINADAKAHMMAATAELYRARLSRDELAMRLPLANLEQSVRVGAENMTGFYQGVDARVRAAASAADVYARAAQAALSSLSSVASASSASFG